MVAVGGGGGKWCCLASLNEKGKDPLGTILGKVCLFVKMQGLTNGLSPFENRTNNRSNAQPPPPLSKKACLIAVWKTSMSEIVLNCLILPEKLTRAATLLEMLHIIKCIADKMLGLRHSHA